jgi:parallel beta-helix repeat protein
MRNLCTLVLILILCFAIVSISEIGIVKAESTTIVVPDNYGSIQEAVNFASDGDTVFVKSGTYVDQMLIINKSISLFGENPKTTILSGRRNDYIEGYPPIRHNVVSLEANDIMISGFTFNVAYTGIGGRGNRTQIIGNILTSTRPIAASGYHCTISKNNMTTMGVYFWGSFNTISENRIVGDRGVSIGGSFNTIFENNIRVGYGINVNGNSNLISNNDVRDGTVGISLESGSQNVVCGNTVTGNWAAGIDLDDTSNNTFYRNTLFNSPNFRIEEPYYQNSWDDGFEGNYYWGYMGPDNDRDGIGDVPYVLSENNTDNYPLMAPVLTFDAGTWECTHYTVTLISSSEITDLSFDPNKGPFLQFDVDGGSGWGFCRVRIPKGLLYVLGKWVVVVDGNIVYEDVAVYEDADFTYLNFSYAHPVTTIKVYGGGTIPEFPSWITLLLLVVGTMVVTIARKKLVKKRLE